MQSITLNPSLGGGLAVRVVGGTVQPSNPKENTIWVNTSTPVTGYRIGPISAGAGSGGQGQVYIATRGETPLEPYVWIADKGDKRIFVSILRAQQYENGLWVNKAARIFRGGAWRDTDVFLYDYGVFTSGAITGFNLSSQVIAGGNRGVLQYGANYTALTVYGDGSGAGQARVSGNAPINVTNYKYIEFITYLDSVGGGNQPTDGYNATYVGLNSSPTFNAGTWLAMASVPAGVQTLAMDISGISGNVYVCTHMYRIYNGGVNTLLTYRIRMW